MPARRIALSLAAAASLVITDPSGAREAGREGLVERYLSSDTESSSQRLSITASVLRSIVNPTSELREKWAPLRGSSVDTNLTLGKIFREHERRAWQDRLDVRQYEAAAIVINGAMILGSAFVPPGTIPAIAQGVAAAGMNAELERAIRQLKQHQQQATRSWLAGSLATLVERGRLDSDLKALADLPFQERRRWISREGLADDLIEQSGKVRKEDRPVVEGMLLQALNQRISSGDAIEVQRDRRSDELLAKEARQTGAVARTLNEFRDETREGLEDIHHQKIQIGEELNTLLTTTGENQRDISFLKRFMFEQMSPEEQLAALRAGMFPGMSIEERERLEKEMDLINRQKKLLESVEEFSRGAASVTRIARRLGVDDNVLKAMNKGTEMAAVAHAALSGITSGGMGYLAAADAISGLVFGAGSDPGIQRHVEIMDALGDIQQGVKEIRFMLTDIQQQMDDVIHLQRATLQAIYNLSEQIEANHRETMAVLADIRQDLVPIRSILREILFQEIEKCFVFHKRLANIGFDNTYAFPATISYDSLRSIDFVNGYGRSCRAGLRSTLSNPFGPEVTYELARFTRFSEDGPRGALSHFLEQVYQPTWRLMNHHILVAGRMAGYFRSFALPVKDVAAIEAKRRVFFSDDPPQFGTAFVGLAESEVHRRLETALFARAIERHACYLAFAHPFFEMNEALAEPTPERLLGLRSPDTEGRELLKSTIELLDIAIAQQVMLSGDATLPDLIKIWQEGIVAEDPNDADPAARARRKLAWDELQVVMHSNVPLRRNLILAAVSESIREARGPGGALLYSIGYNVASDSTYLQAVLPHSQFQLTWRSPEDAQVPHPDHGDLSNSTGWHIRVSDEAEYPLPTPEEIASGELVQMPDLQRLLDLRSRLRIELDGYEIPGSLSAKQRAFLRQTILTIADYRVAKGVREESDETVNTSGDSRGMPGCDGSRS